MYGQSNMETYITICKIANGNSLYGQETQTGALHQPRGVGLGGRLKREVHGNIVESYHICV